MTDHSELRFSVFISHCFYTYTDQAMDDMALHRCVIFHYLWMSVQQCQAGECMTQFDIAEHLFIKLKDHSALQCCVIQGCVCVKALLDTQWRSLCDLFFWMAALFSRAAPAARAHSRQPQTHFLSCGFKSAITSHKTFVYCVLPLKKCKYS